MSGLGACWNWLAGAVIVMIPVVLVVGAAKSWEAHSCNAIGA